MPKLVEVFAAAILVVVMLAIIAIATGFLPSRTGRAGDQRISCAIPCSHASRCKGHMNLSPVAIRVRS